MTFFIDYFSFFKLLVGYLDSQRHGIHLHSDIIRVY